MVLYIPFNKIDLTRVFVLKKLNNNLTICVNLKMLVKHLLINSNRQINDLMI